jgi:hypothetical protein
MMRAQTLLNAVRAREVIQIAPRNDSHLMIFGEYPSMARPDGAVSDHKRSH